VIEESSRVLRSILRVKVTDPLRVFPRPAAAVGDTGIPVITR
jgi:hypothetical protein